MSSTAPAEDIKLVGRSISDAGLSEDVNRLADCLGLRDGSYGELVPVFVSYAASVGRLSLAQTISYNGLPDSFYDAVSHSALREIMPFMGWMSLTCPVDLFLPLGVCASSAVRRIPNTPSGLASPLWSV